MSIRELTKEQQSKPYSKYYYDSITPPNNELIEILAKGPMDPSKALLPENINDLLNPGYFDVETGYCNLENGAGYVTVLNKMPGVTIDMVNWWFAWHGLEDLRYMLWFNKGHFGVSVSEEDRRTILDPNTSMVEKFQGITHHVIENTGMGNENILINFLNPEDFGFDMERFYSPNVGTLVAANGLSSMVGAPEDTPKIPAIMCHFVREIDGGVEFRTRFWMGYRIIDKKPVKLLPPGIKVPIEAIKGLANHAVEEYTHLASFLPKIYKEQKDKPFI
jgi:hypothetical protein